MVDPRFTRILEELVTDTELGQVHPGVNVNGSRITVCRTLPFSSIVPKR